MLPTVHVASAATCDGSGREVQSLTGRRPRKPTCPECGADVVIVLVERETWTYRIVAHPRKR